MREAQEIFYKHLKRVGLKHTDQRDTILRTFLETRDHLSTDELFRLVRKKDAKVGFTTVYRTLKLLAECGLASAVPFPDGMAAGEIARATGVLPNTLSSNLNILSGAGLVASQRHGRSIVYTAAFDRMRVDGIPRVWRST